MVFLSQQAAREIPCTLLDPSKAGFASEAESRSRSDSGSAPGPPSPALPEGCLVEEGTASHGERCSTAHLSLRTRP